jgi:hypothetical protein
MSHVTRRGPVKPTLNITPLIDVVFLLIVFFMLVSKIVTEEVPELQLPNPDQSESFVNPDENRIIINVVPLEPFEGEIGPDAPIGQVLARGGEAEFITIGARKWSLTDGEQLQEFKDFLSDAIAYRLPRRGRPMIFYRCDAAIYYAQSLAALQAVQDAIAQGYEKAGMDLMADPTASNVELVTYVQPK